VEQTALETAVQDAYCPSVTVSEKPAPRRGSVHARLVPPRPPRRPTQWRRYLLEAPAEYDESEIRYGAAAVAAVMEDDTRRLVGPRPAPGTRRPDLHDQGRWLDAADGRGVFELELAEEESGVRHDCSRDTRAFCRCQQ